MLNKVKHAHLPYEYNKNNISLEKGINQTSHIDSTSLILMNKNKP